MPLDKELELRRHPGFPWADRLIWVCVLYQRLLLHGYRLAHKLAENTIIPGLEHLDAKMKPRDTIGIRLGDAHPEDPRWSFLENFHPPDKDARVRAE